MTSPNITTTHAFTTRFGGVSSGIFKSLNLGHRTGDDPANIKENYAALCGALDMTEESIVCSNQVHGTNIRLVSKNDSGKLHTPTGHQADGQITQTPGITLTVFTADCVPILLHDPVKKAIGAVHAGWRGTAANIAGLAVRKMTGEFGCDPADINAAIGPCISGCCYETDADVADSLSKTLGTAVEYCIRQQADKYMVDLKESNRFLLADAGVRKTSVSDECTFCRSDKYWSHRKTAGQRGSQAAVIILRD